MTDELQESDEIQDFETDPADPPAPEGETPEEEFLRVAGEAKGYRKKMIAEKEENAQLKEHVALLQSAVLEGLIGSRMVDPADFTVFGGGVEAVLGEDGRIDRGKVEAKLAEILTERPHLAPPKISVGGRPKQAKGVPSSRTTREKMSSMDRAFGKIGDGSVKWSDILQKRGEHADTATPKDSRTTIEFQ